MDRSFWQKIVDDGFAVPEGYSAQQLMPELISYLGSTDSELRDRFGYYIAGNWIEAGHFTPEELSQMAEQLLHNLSAGLGAVDSDSVFLRSFSVLILAEIIALDNRAPYLAQTLVRRIRDQAIAYLLGEQDLRGYVADKGWAHSAAHTADLLKTLAQSRHAAGPELNRLMVAIADKVTAPTLHRYDCDEDERLVNAVLSVLDRNALGEEHLKAWVERLFQSPGRPAWKDAHRDERELGARHNTKQFAHALCFRLASGESGAAVAPVLLHLLTAPLRAMIWA